MALRTPVRIALAGGAAALLAGPALAAAPNLLLKVDPSVRVDRPVVVRGTATPAGRLVVVVRAESGRVLGRVVRTRVAGAFGVSVPLNDAARPGPAVVAGQLTFAGAAPPVGAVTSTTIVKVEPNFLAALPGTWPAATPIPVKGRLAFPGRLVIVVRDGSGHPLGRTVVEKAARGPFARTIRLSNARPGTVRVSATLRSGSLLVRDSGSLRLT